MPNFAANLTMMFNEVGFLDRFAAAAQAGFKGWIGCEYHPAAKTQAGLAWAAKYIHNN